MVGGLVPGPIGLLGKSFGLKFTAILTGGAFLAGTIGGGIAINKFWLGKVARAENKTLHGEIDKRNQLILDRDNQLKIERGLLEVERESNNRLRRDLKLSDERLNTSQQQTTDALNRVPKDTVRIIEKGDQLGDKLTKDAANAYLRNIWPRELWDFAFGEETTGSAAPPAITMPLAEAGRNTDN